MRDFYVQPRLAANKHNVLAMFTHIACHVRPHRYLIAQVRAVSKDGRVLEMSVWSAQGSEQPFEVGSRPCTRGNMIISKFEHRDVN